MDIHSLKVGKKYRIFDYYNEIFDEIVKITSISIIDNSITFELNGELWEFSNSGFFNEI
jgi:hypothetical protein